MIYKYKNDVIFYNTKYIQNNFKELKQANMEEYTDFFGNTPTLEELNYMITFTCDYPINTLHEQIKYNVAVGTEFIALLREEFIYADLNEVTAFDILAKAPNILMAIMTGAFKEACVLLSRLEPDEFLTTERINKYIECLTSADVINYQASVDDLHQEPEEELIEEPEEQETSEETSEPEQEPEPEVNEETVVKETSESDETETTEETV